MHKGIQFLQTEDITMFRFRLRSWLTITALLVLITAMLLISIKKVAPVTSVRSTNNINYRPVQADMKPFNLSELVESADKIYRGTVISETSGTIEAGGGKLPIVIYRLRVDEPFSGNFETVNGTQIAEIRMLGKTRPVTYGNLKHFSSLPEMPKLTEGESYLLFTTRPVNGGLSATVGLGQGKFHVSNGSGEEKMVINEFNNLGLFRDMDMKAVRNRAIQPDRIQALGSIPYDELARQIRAELAQKGGDRK
jgi:hypothetical protein